MRMTGHYTNTHTHLPNMTTLAVITPPPLLDLLLTHPLVTPPLDLSQLSQACHRTMTSISPPWAVD